MFEIFGNVPSNNNFQEEVLFRNLRILVIFKLVHTLFKSIILSPPSPLRQKNIDKQQSSMIVLTFFFNKIGANLAAPRAEKNWPSEQLI